MPTSAFPHDHSTPMSERKIEIDGKEYSYFDQLVWPGVATTPGLPATAAPIEVSETGLPIGVQIVGPYFEDGTPIGFAELSSVSSAAATSGLRQKPAWRKRKRR
jgi:amidase